MSRVSFKSVKQLADGGLRFMLQALDLLYCNWTLKGYRTLRLYLYIWY